MGLQHPIKALVFTAQTSVFSITISAKSETTSGSKSASGMNFSTAFARITRSNCDLVQHISQSLEFRHHNQTLKLFF